MAGNIQTLLARIVGAVLTVVGLVGFFSGDALLMFGLNPLHNVVHLVSGVVGLWAGFTGGCAVHYNKWFGVIYILVAVLGFVVPDLMVSLLNINAADNLLHLLLGVVLAGVGFGAKS